MQRIEELINTLTKDELQTLNKSILNYVQLIASYYVTKSDYVIDMTVGNGHDTLFLGKIAKKVFGFDIQQEAIHNTTKLLTEEGITNYQLFLESHENVDLVLPQYKQQITLILFNLGYLPRGDKTITTTAETTLMAIKKSLIMLNNKGIILVVFYLHEEGVKEATVVKNYLLQENIDYQIYRNTDNINAPYLLVIDSSC